MGQFLKWLLNEGLIDDLLTPMSKDEVPSNWSKNADGSYDVDGDVDLRDRGLLELPFRFRKVTGNFSCTDNQLTNLEGSPDSVGGNFYCSNNKLTSLYGAPDSVGRNFDCEYNKLTNLEGAPDSVGRNFYCFYNQLTSLDGAPNSVGGDFSCFNNQKKFSEEDVRKVCVVKGKIDVSGKDYFKTCFLKGVN